MFTTKELATYLGLATITVRIYVHRGKIEARKLGRDWIISDEEAERLKKYFSEKRTTDKRSKRTSESINQVVEKRL